MHIQTDVSLKDLTTFRLGGNARYFCITHSISELQEAFIFSKKQKLTTVILGEGSNILVGDKGFPGLVIKIELKGICFEEKENGSVFVIAGAGEHWDTLVKDSIEKGLYGIENLSGIPGTVGATPIQNIGAYGVEVKDVIVWVEAFNPQTRECTIFKNKECQFSYRHSFFKTEAGNKFVITKVCYKLKRNSILTMEYKDVTSYFKDKDRKKISLHDMRKAIIEIRKQKFPDVSSVGTAGSFFKNPIVSKEEASTLGSRFPGLPQYPLQNGDIKLSLAWLLDHILGWKGVRRGAVGTFSRQPLVLVHYGGGNAAHMQALAKEIQKNIKSKTNLDIVPEISFVGEF